ncbi:MAG: type I-E CRISPR-associated protein Cas6/Cse3/CasE [Sphaerochaetaceae bacterium]
MIASQVSLNRNAIQQLKLSDPYAIHKFVYNLFPGVKRNFLYYDQGGNWQYRKILILSEEQPTLPPFGKIESKYIPPTFLHHKTYAFQVLLNPVDHPAGKKNKSPVIGKGALYDWFLKRQAYWGFSANPISLEIFNEGVQIIEGKGRVVTHNRAEFRGILQVTNYDLFHHSFVKGIGRAKAFGFGLLQLRPIKEKETTDDYK